MDPSHLRPGHRRAPWKGAGAAPHTMLLLLSVPWHCPSPSCVSMCHLHGLRAQAAWAGRGRGKRAEMFATYAGHGRHRNGARRALTDLNLLLVCPCGRGPSGHHTFSSCLSAANGAGYSRWTQTSGPPRGRGVSPSRGYQRRRPAAAFSRASAARPERRAHQRRLDHVLRLASRVPVLAAGATATSSTARRHRQVHVCGGHGDVLVPRLQRQPVLR